MFHCFQKNTPKTCEAPKAAKPTARNPTNDKTAADINVESFESDPEPDPFPAPNPINNPKETHPIATATMSKKAPNNKLISITINFIIFD